MHFTSSIPSKIPFKKCLLLLAGYFLFYTSFNALWWIVSLGFAMQLFHLLFYGKCEITISFYLRSTLVWFSQLGDYLLSASSTPPSPLDYLVRWGQRTRTSKHRHF